MDTQQAIELGLIPAPAPQTDLQKAHQLMQGTKPITEQLKDIGQAAIEAGIDMTPVIGDIMQGYEVIKGERITGKMAAEIMGRDQDIEKLSPLARIIMGAVAAIPFVPTRIFSGLKSKGGRQIAEEANRMFKAKEPGIFEKTGVFMSPFDKKPRIEISDVNARLKPMEMRNIYNLGDVLDHPELFDAYPDLADIKIKRTFMEKSSLGEFRNNRITINEKSGIDTVLHEVQHWVQKVEDFAKGGNTGTANPFDYIPELERRYTRELKSTDALDSLFADNKLKRIKKLKADKPEYDEIIKQMKEIDKKSTKYYKLKEKQLSYIQKAENLPQEQREKIGSAVKGNLEKINKKRGTLITEKINLLEKKHILESQPYVENLRSDTYEALAGEIEAREISKRADQGLTGIPEFDLKPEEVILIKQNQTSKMVEGYHGSPHKFDKFTTEKIGTGEGAQAFGYGLYFTDDPGIAGHYARKLGEAFRIDNINIGKMPTSPSTTGFAHSKGITIEEAVKTLSSEEYLKRDIAEYMRSYGKNYERFLPEDLKPLNNKLKKEGRIVEQTGQVYKVKLHGDIPEGQENWLDWYEKPKKEQIDQIIKQSKKEKLGIEDYEITLKDENLKSSDIYQSLKKFFGKKTESGHTIIRGSEKEVSQFLDRAGIHGIRYPTKSLSGGGVRNIQKEKDELFKKFTTDISDRLFDNRTGRLPKQTEIEQVNKIAKDVLEGKKDVVELTDYVYEKEGNLPHWKIEQFKEMWDELKNYKQQHNYVIFNEKAVEIVPNNP